MCSTEELRKRSLQVSQMQEKEDVSLSIKLTNSEIKGVFNFYIIRNKKANPDKIEIDIEYKKVLIYTTETYLLFSHNNTF